MSGREHSARLSPARRLALLVGALDPDVARWLSTAAKSWRRICARDAPELLPDEAALAEVLGALDHAARSGQLAARLAVIDVDRPLSTFLSYAQAAEITGLSVRSVRRRVADGRLRAHRVGRRVLIDPADLLDHQGA
jgi:excisionase family DNA binding protein